jgi:multidrug efflux pump subunit AcrB
VLLRAEKLREYNVSVGEVVAALRAQNTNAPVGKVQRQARRGEHSPGRAYRVAGGVPDIVVKRFAGQVVRLAAGGNHQ